MSNSVTHWKRCKLSDDAKWRRQQRKAARMTNHDYDYGQHEREAKAFNRELFVNWHADTPRPRWRWWALWLCVVVVLAVVLWSKGL